MVPDPYSRAALARVPALTLQAPWALAVTDWGKTVENRIWPPPRGLRRLYIHAGKGTDHDGFDYLRSLGYSPKVMATCPRSAIVALVDLTAVCSAARGGGLCGCHTPWAMPDQLHWLLGNVIKLPEPVPARGMQRLWHPDPATVDAIAATLATLDLPLTLVCNGRRLDSRGRPRGMPCGVHARAERGETYTAMELRVRRRRWKVGPLPDDGSMPDAMCPGCANPSSAERDLIQSLRPA